VRDSSAEVAAVLCEAFLACPGFPIGEGTMPGGLGPDDLAALLLLSLLLLGDGGGYKSDELFRVRELKLTSSSGGVDEIVDPVSFLLGLFSWCPDTNDIPVIPISNDFVSLESELSGSLSLATADGSLAVMVD
jgi:hypothetical protein